MRGDIVTSNNEKGITIKPPAKHCQECCEGCFKDGQCTYQDWATGWCGDKGKFYL